MIDKTHEEFIDRWAIFVKNNPNKWQKTHADFINSQILHSQDFIKKLSKKRGGKQKIISLYNIKNIGGYKNLL
ncbi:MAG: hypothetical protein ACP5NV_00610 [Candidatus Woesearchaeota archaeon]